MLRGCTDVAILRLLQATLILFAALTCGYIQAVVGTLMLCGCTDVWLS